MSTASILTLDDAREAARIELARRDAVRTAARKLAPVKPPKPKLAPKPGMVVKPTREQFTLAVELIDASGLVEDFDKDLPDATGRATGGAPRILTTRALLAGFLLLAMTEQPFLVRDAARLLDGLTPRQRTTLGLPARRAITERMVSRLWNHIAALVNPSPHAACNAHLFDREFWRAAGVLSDPEPTAEDEALAEPTPEGEPAAARGASVEDIELARAADVVLSDQHERLRRTIETGLGVTHALPEVPDHTGSYALDASLMGSWARPARGKTPSHLRVDPEAAWRTIKGRNPVFGFAVHTMVRVPEKADPGCRPTVEVPELIEAFDVTSARMYNTHAGMTLLERVVARHDREDDATGREPRPRRDLLADREYSRNRDWQENAFGCGFTTVFDLAREQRGVTGTLSNGALVIDGIPFSPGVPSKYKKLPYIDSFATVEDTARTAQGVLDRDVYRLRPQGARRADGSLDLACPASTLVRALRCNNKPRSLAHPATRPLVGTALPIITTTVKPDVCGKEKTRIPFDELPFWQEDPWMSPRWQASYNRRSHVEAAFGHLKDEATHDITRGNIRVLGVAKVSLLLMFAAMAYNIRVINNYEERRKAAELPVKPVRTRKPRARTRKILDVREKIETRRIMREATLAAAAAAVTAVDESLATVTELPLVEDDPPPF